MTDGIGWHTEIAEEFDGRYDASPAFQERLALWTAAIAEHAKPEMTAFDIGCGSGRLTVELATRTASVFAVDGSPDMLRLAQRRCAAAALSNVEFAQVDLDSEPLPAGTADVIVCSSVIEYLDDFERALSALASALKPGGKLLLSVPNGNSLYRKAERLLFKTTHRPRYYEHVNHVPSEYALSTALADVGLSINRRILYGKAPVWSTVARRIGLHRYADTLAFVCAERNA